jgi:hypothetical protein
MLGRFRLEVRALEYFMPCQAKSTPPPLPIKCDRTSPLFLVRGAQGSLAENSQSPRVEPWSVPVVANRSNSRELRLLAPSLPPSISAWGTIGRSPWDRAWCW